jgi:hypothetical protein
MKTVVKCREKSLLDVGPQETGPRTDGHDYLKWDETRCIDLDVVTSKTKPLEKCAHFQLESDIHPATSASINR